MKKKYHLVADLAKKGQKQTSKKKRYGFCQKLFFILIIFFISLACSSRHSVDQSSQKPQPRVGLEKSETLDKPATMGKVQPHIDKSQLFPANGLLWSRYLGSWDLFRAKEKCKARGMRLPTKNELQALARSNSPVRFQGCQRECWYWSSTVHPRFNPSLVYCVNSITGETEANHRDVYMGVVKCVTEQ